MIRRYDQAVMDFLQTEVNGEPIPLVFATPRREFGMQRELDEDGTGRLRTDRAQKTVRLPSMALQRMDWQPSELRQNLAVHRRLGWSHDLNLVAQAQHPMAVDFSYQLDIWTKYRDDANFLVATMMTRFPRIHASLTVDLGPPWGKKRVFLRRESVADNSDLEPGDDSDREVRMTLDLLLEGWLPFGFKEVRTVRRVCTDYDLFFHENGRGFDTRAFTICQDDQDRPGVGSPLLAPEEDDGAQLGAYDLGDDDMGDD